MKTPLGTEVDLGPGHIVLDGVSALRERGPAAPIFSAHVYCGHGRPSQLLLSSCKVRYHTHFSERGLLYAFACLSVACLSVCSSASVCNARAPYAAG